MSKKPQHHCTAACDIPGPGLAKHNREVLASLNEGAEVAEFSPEFKDAVNTRKPWPALERAWAEQGVSVEVDEYGLYSYRNKENGATLYSCSISAPAKPVSGPTAIVPKLNAAGSPSLFAGFKRIKVRDLTTAELEALDEELCSKADFDCEGVPQELSTLRCAVLYGDAIVVFAPLQCRQWQPEEIAAREAKCKRADEEFAARFYKDFGMRYDPDDVNEYAAVPESPHPHGLPLASASVIVTDPCIRAGTLYIETEEEQIDVFA